MKLLVIVLNRAERLSALMKHLAEMGVEGATVLESEGMGKVISEDAPLLAQFGHLLTGVRAYNRTVLSLVEDDWLAHRVLATLAREVPGEPAGVAFSLPVDDFVRLKPL